MIPAQECRDKMLQNLLNIMDLQNKNNIWVAKQVSYRILVPVSYNSCYSRCRFFLILRFFTNTADYISKDQVIVRQKINILRMSQTNIVDCRRKDNAVFKTSLYFLIYFTRPSKLLCPSSCYTLPFTIYMLICSPF